MIPLNENETLDIKTFSSDEKFIEYFTDRLYKVGEKSLGIVASMDFIVNVFYELIKLEEIVIGCAKFHDEEIGSVSKKPYLLYVNGFGELYTYPLSTMYSLAYCEEWFIDMDGSVTQDTIDEAVNYGCKITLFGEEDPIGWNDTDIINKNNTSIETDGIVDEDDENFHTFSCSKNTEDGYVSVSLFSSRVIPNAVKNDLNKVLDNF